MSEEAMKIAFAILTFICMSPTIVIGSCELWRAIKEMRE